MAHGLDHVNSRYVGRLDAWHKLGNAKGRYLTREEVAETVCFPVEKRQLSIGLPDGTYSLVDAYGTFRTDTQDFLGSVGEGYKVIPGTPGIEMIEALLSDKETIPYESAVVIGKGEKCAVSVGLDDTFSVGPYEHKNYLNFIFGHDGLTAYQWKKTCVNVVCNNTLQMALAAKTNSCLKVYHTKNAQPKLDRMNAALELIHQETQDVGEKLNFLATRKVEKANVESLLNKLFPKKEEEKFSTRRDNILADIIGSYEDCHSRIFPETGGSAFNLLNAITGYVDHARGGDNDKKSATSALFGSGQALKNSAYEIIMEQSNSMSPIYTRSWSHREQAGLLDTIIANG